MADLKEKQINPEIETTLFRNIDSEPFDIYINGKLARHLEAGEEQTLVFYVAQVGAKHLVDRILQKQGVKDSLRDTPERQSLFAKILPNVAEDRGIKPQTEEDFRKGIQDQLKQQAELIASFINQKKADDEKDKKIADLETKLAQVLEAIEKKKGGRPPKNKVE